jgi:hypothetical protein
LVAITNNPAGLKKSNLGLKTQAGLSKLNVPLKSLKVTLISFELLEII